MKKVTILMIALFGILLGATVNAASDTEQIFSNYESVDEVIPGRLFSMYTKTKPALETVNSVKSLKIDSADNSDNILLMNPQSFKTGSFSVKFSASVDSAPNVNWGRAPHVIIRYKNANGSWVNDTVAEFAYNVIRVKVDGKEVSASAFKSGTFYDFEFDFLRKDNTFIVSYKIDKNSYTKEYTTCDDGEICVGFFSYLGNAMYLKNIAFSETFSKGLTDSGIKTEFFKNNPSRPRILIDSDRLKTIKELIKTDEKFALWYSNVKAKADAALTAPISKYELRDGQRLLYVSRDVYNNAVYPAFVYLIEGGEQYKNRAWSELSAVAEFKDWHPAHFLDTAEMVFAFAVCYDWLYNDWNENQRSVIYTAIKNLGLEAANESYNSTAEYDENTQGAYHNRIGWKNDSSNWGLVCNGGIAVGAMSIMDEGNADYCANILEDAMLGLETPMKEYSCDGAWSEGTGYWHYATGYLSYMMASMENTLGSTYGYMESEGVKNSSNYLLAHTGTCGTFNYGDCDKGVISAPELFWLADFYSDATIADARLNVMERFNIKGGIDDILFYNPDIGAGEQALNLSSKFDSVGVVTATSSFTDKNANYIGFKAGEIGVNHGDLDAGSFVIDALGERWVSDYGSDSYTLDGYFEWSKRINYFRKRAEGHSTLVINPDSGADQKVGSVSPITEYISGRNGMMAVADLTEAYSDDSDSVRRMVSLFVNNTKFMVQDEVKSQTPSDVYWYLQTDKSISLATDKKSLTLSKGNKKMLIVLQSNNPNARFSVLPAQPIGSSPNPEGQEKNNEYMRICVVNEDVTDLTMRVTFIPYMEGATADRSVIRTVVPIDEMIENTDLDNDYALPKAVLKMNGNVSDKLSDGNANIKVNVNKNGTDIYIAHYDMGGILKSVKYFKNADYSIEADFEVKQTDSLKVFAWDSAQKPLSAVNSFTN